MIATALATIVPVLWTPYGGDDVINQALPEEMARTNQSWWDIFSSLTNQWIQNQGRFFPGSVAYSITVFTVFTSRLAYKLFLLLVLTAALIAFATWMRRATGSWATAQLAALVAVSTWQFRGPTWHDSVTAYAGLLPYTSVLVFVALALVTSSGRPATWRFLLAGAAWALASVTYEVVVVLAPVAIAALWLRPSTRRVRLLGALAIGVPTVVDVVVVAVLRSRVHTPTAPAYTLSFAPGDVISTTWQQMLAVVPVSQRWLHADLRPAVDLGPASITLAIAVGALALAAILSLRHAVPTTVNLYLLAVVGVWLWFVPAALVGVTQRWQTELPDGQGYLSVMFETFGFSLVALSCLGALQRVASSRIARARVAARMGVAVLVAALASALAINAMLNAGVAAHYG